MPFDFLAQLLIIVFIVLAMLCVGLAVERGDILAVLHDRSKTGRALLANLVIAPLVAIILTMLVPMPAAAAAVLLLLGFAPGGINAIQFSTKAPGQLATSAGMLFLLSACAIIITPIAAGFILDAEADVVVPFGSIVLRGILLVVLPLLAGMVIRNLAPALADKLYKPAMLISTVSFIASVLASLSMRQEALGELGGNAVLAMLAFILITMAVGWWLGGPEREHRQALAVITNLRNVGLVYVIVEECCGDPLLPLAVLAFMALMVPPNLILTLYNAFWRKKRGH